MSIGSTIKWNEMIESLLSMPKKISIFQYLADDSIYHSSLKNDHSSLKIIRNSEKLSSGKPHIILQENQYFIRVQTVPKEAIMNFSQHCFDTFRSSVIFSISYQSLWKFCVAIFLYWSLLTFVNQTFIHKNCTLFLQGNNWILALPLPRL